MNQPRYSLQKIVALIYKVHLYIDILLFHQLYTFDIVVDILLSTLGTI